MRSAKVVKLVAIMAKFEDAVVNREDINEKKYVIEAIIPQNKINRAYEGSVVLSSGLATYR